MERANAEREHMGLTTWENSPNGKIVKTDVSVWGCECGGG